MEEEEEEEEEEDLLVSRGRGDTLLPADSSPSSSSHKWGSGFEESAGVSPARLGSSS